MMNNQQRLVKILSAHGVASRREADRLIHEGRVCVNGITAVTGQKAEFGSDLITVDGITLAAGDEPVYIMLNKPRGYITTKRDDRGRKTVMSLVDDVGSRVYPVGRLDMDSEGLLLFTNDGNFANTVAHPSYNKEKEYEVIVCGDVRKAVSLLRQPIEIDNHVVRAVRIKLLQTTADGGTLKITVTEGRNRQIRKMCAASGVRVKTLRRISIGKLELGNLKSGQWRYLTGEEVESLG